MPACCFPPLILHALHTTYVVVNGRPFDADRLTARFNLIDQGILSRAEAVTMSTNESSDERFDYRAKAELFPGKNIKVRLRVFKYMRFDHAADAIRFAVERLPANILSGAFWRSTKSDTTAVEFVTCMTALNIHS